MKLDIKATAITSGLLWGGAVLTVGIINMLKPTYGRQFLRLAESIYPGYHATPNAKGIAVGTGYALLDGAAGGAIFAAIYNSLERREHEVRISSRAA